MHHPTKKLDATTKILSPCPSVAAGVFDHRNVAGVFLANALRKRVNNRWMLHPIDAGLMTAVSKIEGDIEQLRDPTAEDPFTVSVLNMDFHNQKFYTESSQTRVAELATWRREMLFPKTHLLIDDLRLLGSFTSIWPKAFDQTNGQIVDADASVQNVENAASLNRSSDAMAILRFAGGRQRVSQDLWLQGAAGIDRCVET